ncbi:helix-turn-helix transcriptional regulator [Qipengyuania sp. SS22]|uniref:helix-turn-helix domain-containing protein n=1 Tax=Qipengyuania sp. SS22 TaxID=2979461 RepID=UPI0021E55DDD|nr:helix-turn-helix transcriptional regulator [Qipengyuania sp. SS22]UYH55183.1 helix-turn-helix transcriptional regulator [Qipengyuania sp. SS22]
MPTAAMLASFLALVLAVFLALVPSRTRLANGLLALFLIVTVIDISGWFGGRWWASVPGLAALRPVTAALNMPLFTGFIWFACFERDRLKPRDALHLMIPALVLGFVLARARMPFLQVLLEVQYAVYIGIAIYALARVRSDMQSRFAGVSSTWWGLAFLLGSSLIAHGLFLVRVFAGAALPASVQDAMQTGAATLVLIIIVGIALQALLRPDLFRGGDRLFVKATTSGPDDGGQVHRGLTALMEAEQPYLDPELSLQRLARRCRVSAKALSEAINRRDGTHFFDFVNRYRIEHAQALLTQTDRSVTDILHASGFNSKSSFNTAFRKHSGTTPSAYRRTNRGY